MTENKTVIGISLGTKYCCVSVFRNGQAEIINNKFGCSETPSIVTFTEDKILVGDEAKEQSPSYPTNTIFDFQSMIGLKFSDPYIQDRIKSWPFKVVCDKDGNPQFEVQYHNQTTQISPIQILSYILKYIKNFVDENLCPEIVTDAVISVPPHFNNLQRQSILRAGKLACLNVVRIIDDPVASAISFLSKEFPKNKSEKTVLVYDFGGTKIDASLLRVDGKQVNVLSTEGGFHLGGQDIDANLLHYFARRFQSKHDLDLRGDNRAMWMLWNSCERAKKVLSRQQSAQIFCPSLYKGIDFNDSIDRTTFEEINTEIFEKVLEPVQKVLNSAKISQEGVDHIVLAGGSSQIPRIRHLLKEFFGNKPCAGAEPSSAAASGAAIIARSIETVESRPPKTYTIPQDIGVNSGGKMDVIIPRNTLLPVKRTTSYTTVMDYQQAISFDVYMGNDSYVKNNTLLCNFTFDGIRRAKVGEPKIEVKFTVDKNMILTVSVKDKSIGTSKKMEIRINKDD